MAGIYLHLPFCRQACTYCNFHFATSLRYKAEMVNALCAEMALQSRFLNGETINTVYFGGGTPSLLQPAELKQLMQTLHQHFSIAPGAEVTLEANPDDMNMDILKTWQALGINRLSIGVQSFFEEELRWMNRAHTASQAHRAIEQTHAAGYTNFSIDLIYGSPLLTGAGWQQNVETALQYNVPHLSCYALTVEERTPLYKKIKEQRVPDVVPDVQATQFLNAMQWLGDAGYEHYEVSNFAKPGLRSRHNTAYWQGIPYLGLGPSAHSYNGTQRQWNVANNTAYISAIQTGTVPAESETLTATQQLNEYLMIALRTCEGIDLDKLERAWGFEKVVAVLQKSARYNQAGALQRSETHLRLTNQGMLLADGIAAHLFF